MQTSFFIRLRPALQSNEIGIPSLLAIFPYQPAKPPLEFQQNTSFSKASTLDSIV